MDPTSDPCVLASDPRLPDHVGETARQPAGTVPRLQGWDRRTAQSEKHRMQDPKDRAIDLALTRRNLLAAGAASLAISQVAETAATSPAKAQAAAIGVPAMSNVSFEV